MSLPTVGAEGRHTDMPVLLMQPPVIGALADQNTAGSTENKSVLFKAAPAAPVDIQLGRHVL